MRRLRNSLRTSTCSGVTLATYPTLGATTGAGLTAARNFSRTSFTEYACLAGNVMSGRLIAWHTWATSSSRASARWLACDRSFSSTAQTIARSLARQITKSTCLAATRLSAPCRADLLRPVLTSAKSASRTLPRTLCSAPTAWSSTPRNERSAAENRNLAGSYGKPTALAFLALEPAPITRTAKITTITRRSNHNMRSAPFGPKVDSPKPQGFCPPHHRAYESRTRRFDEKESYRPQERLIPFLPYFPVTGSLVPALPVWGFTLPFVDQLSRLV